MVHGQFSAGQFGAGQFGADSLVRGQFGAGQFGAGSIWCRTVWCRTIWCRTVRCDGQFGANILPIFTRQKRQRDIGAVYDRTGIFKEPNRTEPPLGKGSVRPNLEPNRTFSQNIVIAWVFQPKPSVSERTRPRPYSSSARARCCR